MVNTFLRQITNLKASRVRGYVAPHKAVLLLGVLELVEYDILKENRIALTDELEDAFKYVWKRYIGNSSIFKCDIFQPFWYMKSEPFWTIYHVDGSLAQLTDKKPGRDALKDGYYAELDPVLFNLLQNSNTRALLRVALIAKYLQSVHSINSNS